MRRAIWVFLLVVSSGCYASHELETDGGGTDGGIVDASAPDGGSCFEAESDIYVRNDCEFCNALHFTWLRRCGSTVTLAASLDPTSYTSFRLGPCGALTMDACVGARECLPRSECAAHDVSSLEALLALRAEFSPRGGALPFEPYDPESDMARWLVPPECDALAAAVSICD